MKSRGRAPRADDMTKKLFIRTFGCQMNEYDSDKMADLLRAAKGFEITDQPENADLILFNTCSVRERAQEKVFHDLGRVKYLLLRPLAHRAGVEQDQEIGRAHV